MFLFGVNKNQTLFIFDKIIAPSHGLLHSVEEGSEEWE